MVRYREKVAIGDLNTYLWAVSFSLQCLLAHFCPKAYKIELGEAHRIVEWLIIKTDEVKIH